MNTKTCTLVKVKTHPANDTLAKETGHTKEDAGVFYVVVMQPFFRCLDSEQ